MINGAAAIECIPVNCALRRGSILRAATTALRASSIARAFQGNEAQVTAVVTSPLFHL
jgi:hypothetical protein